ncbi:phytanoyl-CoA dioxygenase family protein [Paenibacillus montanisoli]|uniref:Phytanoyl-CoA dioxygenase n=1 Tax=Paenibacillus montanisoli TaxID=2081970 RepID=A0A328UBY3_9BACL|nr:phytanoyl-CoA dioxygenase family protein [Paenibacillus montanisoli]RAP78415.1 hypothetical protein DL346_08320 [Paenibacillus montanisoli]
MSFVDQYREEGYVCLRNVLSEQDLNPVIGVISKFIDQKAKEWYAEGKISDKFEHLSIYDRWAKISSMHYENKGLMNLELFSREVYDLIRNPKLVQFVEQVVGQELAANGDWWVRSKLPHEDKTTYPWHQDSFYYGGQDAWNPDFHILSVWIPLLDVDTVNGCLQLIPGSNKWGRVPFQMNEHNHLVPAINVEEKGEILTMEMQKGDVLFFNQLTLHRSLPNLSEHVRWSIDLRYSPANQPFSWHIDPDFGKRFPNLIVKRPSDPSKETTWEQWYDRHLNRM